MTNRDRSTATGGRVHIARSRGALSGFLLVLLGIWGALIPFVGPWFHFAYTPDNAWAWTTARGWFEVLPGAVTAFGGFLLLTSSNRLVAVFGSWLAVAGGAWFVVGPTLSQRLTLGDIGAPAASTKGKATVLELAFFNGLGAVILFLAAVALGRLTVHSMRDVRFAQRQADQVSEPVDKVPAYAPPTSARPTSGQPMPGQPTSGQATPVRPTSVQPG